MAYELPPSSDEVRQQQEIALRASNPEAIAEKMAELGIDTDPVIAVQQRIADHLEALELDPSLTANQRAFLRAYSVQPIVARASRIAGVHRNRHHEWLQQSEAYAKAFDQARQLGADFLEAEAFHRAVVGWFEPIFQKGGLVGYVHKTDSNLLRMLLQGHRPELYSQKTQVQIGGERSTVQINIDAETMKAL